MATTAVSSVRLFLNKLGKWQGLVIIVVLLGYLITHFTSNEEDAGLDPALLAALLAALFASVAAFMAGTASGLSFFLPSLKRWFFTANVTFVASITAVAAVLSTFSSVLVIIPVIATACFLVRYIATKAKEHGVSKKTVWFSFVAEFVVILLPMLLVH